MRLLWYDLVLSIIEVPREFTKLKSGNKTSLEEIGLNIRTYASPKVGHDQLSRCPEK